MIADFPLVRTTIIDGTVTLFDDKGNKRELSDIVVELQDSAGKAIRRVISEVDGYFSFDKVEACNYFLSIPDEALATYNAIIDQKIPIIIEEINEFKTGNEITLHQKQTSAPNNLDQKLIVPSASEVSPNAPAVLESSPAKALLPLADSPQPNMPVETLAKPSTTDTRAPKGSTYDLEPTKLPPSLINPPEPNAPDDNNNLNVIQPYIISSWTICEHMQQKFQNIATVVKKVKDAFLKLPAVIPGIISYFCC